MASGVHARARSQRGLLKPLRLADLMALDPSSGEMAAQVEALDRAARLVIGDNLARGTLTFNQLVRLRGAILRQRSDGQTLRKRLQGTEAAPEVGERLGRLLDYFDWALSEIDRQMGAATRTQ